MRFLVFLMILLVLPGIAGAQDMLRDHREDDPVAKLLPDATKDPQTVADYANLFYERCNAEAKEHESLRSYVETQCTCTAAALPGMMTLQDMQALFTKTNEGSFQQGRVYMLAYIPCLATSMKDLTYDNCRASLAVKERLKYPDAVCGCMARNISEFTAKYGQNLIPGFSRQGFSVAKSVPDPFTTILNSDAMALRLKDYGTSCLSAKPPQRN